MFNKKMKAWLAVGALAAVLAVSGCGGNGDKAKSGDAVKSGVPSIVRVGAETTFPPFEFTKDDKYVGFDLDLAEAVIKQMGSKMEFKSMGFDALIPAVQSGQIDMIASGLSANPEREKQVAFSDVYFDKNGFVIIVNKDNNSLKDWADLEPQKVEMALWKIIPPEEGSDLCHRFVMHGRAVCNARKPECERCCLNDICRYAAENAVLTKETKEASV